MAVLASLSALAPRIWKLNEPCLYQAAFGHIIFITEIATLCYEVATSLQRETIPWVWKDGSVIKALTSQV